MRKLYNEFFYIPKHGKIREKVMLTRVAMTVVIMVVCLTAMSITAYAYFSYNVTSGSNIIKAANFDADVSITIIGQNNEVVTVAETNSLPCTVELLAGTYSVKLKASENSTAKTGFCIVKIDETQYHTQQIGTDETVSGEKTELVEFQIKIVEKATVAFLAHWGTSVYYDEFQEKGDQEELYITVGETIVVDSPGSANLIGNPDEGEKEISSAETVTTTTEAAVPSASDETMEPTSSATTTSSDAPNDTTSAQTDVSSADAILN